MKDYYESTLEDTRAAAENEILIMPDMLYYPVETRTLAENLTEDDLVLPGSRKLLKAIKTLIAEGKPYDETSILQKVVDLSPTVNEKEQIGNNFQGHQTASVVFVEEHIKAFERYISNRRVKEITQNASGKTPDELIEDIKKAAFLLTPKVNYKAVFDRYKETTFNPPEKLKTEYNGIDKKLCGGFAKGSLAIIGARPRVGKTSLACNIAAKQVLQDKRVLFFTLEMTEKALLDRFAAIMQKIDYGTLVRGHLNTETEIQFNAFMDYIRTCNIEDRLMINDKENGIDEICHEIKRVLPDIVYIDYIQIVTQKNKYNTRRESIDYIIDRLKATAKETNCVIVALSQLSRNAEDTAPSIADLKESGHLEEAGDYILLLDRRTDYDPEEDEKDERQTAALNIVKNKYGETTKENLRFEGEYQTFSPTETKYKEH